MYTFKQFIILEKAIDTFQAALDIAGIAPDPVIGTSADGINSMISLLRAKAAKTSDDRKKHLINAGISAISIIPMADIIKVLKLKQISRPLTKCTIHGCKYVRRLHKAHKDKTLKALQAGIRINRAKDRIASSD